VVRLKTENTSQRELEQYPNVFPNWERVPEKTTPYGREGIVLDETGPSPSNHSSKISILIIGYQNGD